MIEFSQFKDYIDEKLPDFLDDTDEEFELNLMKDTGMNTEEINKTPVSIITIYRLIKLKEAFVNWMVNKPEETT